MANELPPNTCPDCAHDPGKCIHPMDFTEINDLLRRIRETALAAVDRGVRVVTLPEPERGG